MKKLDGDNYHAWAIRARAVMVQKRCWEAIDPGYGPEDMTDAQKKKNDEALTLLFLIVEDTFLDDIGDCIRAKDAWTALKEMHTKFGLLHVLQLMKDFFNITMKPGESIQSYLARLVEIHRKLSNGGYAFTDREVALVMLIGLPKSYESLILNLEKDEASLTTTIVKSKLLIEEKRISRNLNTTEDHEERALHTKNYNQKKFTQTNSTKRWQPKKNEVSSSTKKNTKCFSCGEWGHISRNCSEAQQKTNQSSAKTAIDLKTNWAFLTNQEKESTSRLWILDSGATEHMTSDRSKFTTLKDYSSIVEVANSEKIEVTGTGDITISVLEDSEERKNITLANALYVPNLGGNLLSLGRIEERGFKVQFAHGEAKVLSQNDEVILKARRKGRLYMVVEDQPVAYLTKTTDDLWHSRLGHPCQSASKNLESTNNSKQEPHSMPKKTCTVCIKGKMKRKKFPKFSNTRSKEVLEVIHSDVVGKISPPSLGGSNYFVVFTDDFSRHSTVYPIKTKDQVLEKFAEYKHMSENFHNRRIKALRSDNGGEFKSNDFNKYLAEHGIQRQLSAPESPQQNGLAERMNGILINISRCLLIESGADPKFWAEAVCTASHLHNKRPSSAINGNTPDKLWSGKEISLGYLKVFGCRAWSHVRSFQKRSKFDPKASECVLVGYPDGIKGYKLWDLKEKRFLISRDVIFEEDIFPLKLEQGQTHKEDNKVNLLIENEEIENMQQTGENTDQDGGQPLNTSQDAEEIDNQNTDETNRQDEENVDPSQSIKTEEEPGKSGSEVEGLTVTVSDSNCEDENYSRPRTINLPKHLEDYYLYSVQEIKQPEDKDPVTVKDALQSSEADMWKKAMNEEIKNLAQAQTWELTTKPPGVKVIPCRWLFRKKKDEAGNRSRFKARLVAKGYLQVSGENFQDTFSPVIKLKSIRVLLAIAAEKELEIHQMDITAAYLNGVLEEDIYMAQPEGCIERGNEHLVCHLKRSLYGLRQSGRIWNTCLNDFLTSYGLRRSNADPCIYYCHLKRLIVGVYVDDLLIVGDIEEINKLKKRIKGRFAAKDLGPANQILSMQINREAGGSYTLDQTAYVSEILETFKMTEAKHAATPLDPSLKYYKVDDQRWERIKNDSKEIPYRQAIGSLLYLTCGTRPDMAYSATYMSQFNERPAEEHWRGVKHILRYLKGTQCRKLKFQKTCQPLQIYSDADWGGDRTDRKSYSGYIMLLAGAPISWSSKKQPTTALSSTEAEYVAMCHTAKEILWMNKLLREISCEFTSSPQKVFVDNQGAIFIANNHVTSERCKHIDIKYFFLRDLVKDHIISFEHVPSSDNLADLLTKQVSKRILSDTNYGRTHLDKFA